MDVAGLNVLVRSDLNVPIDQSAVADEFRIAAALPTLERLVGAGAVVTVCSHFGRPNGVNPDLSLGPVATRMNEMSDLDVALEQPADITVLENTRFHAGETTNSAEFAAELADGFDLFVQDAFGSVHRAHASTVGVAERVRSVAGPLLDSELTALGRFTDEPDRPYVVVLGGAKISDKLGVIENLLPKVDVMLIGGGMCFTLLAAEGIEVGRSLAEQEMVDAVRQIIEGPDREKIVLPSDLVVTSEFAAEARPETVAVEGIGADTMGLDIGPETAARFGDSIRDSKSAFWNGPMESSSGKPSGRAPKRWLARWRTQRGLLPSAAATRPLPCGCLVSRGRSLTCRPAGERAWNCWKAAFFPAWPSSRDGSNNLL